MKADEFHNAIGLLDDELVREVDILRHNTVAKVKSKAPFKRYASVAACLCVLIIGVAALSMFSASNKSETGAPKDHFDENISNENAYSTDPLINDVVSKDTDDVQYIKGEIDLPETEAIVKPQIDKPPRGTDATSSGEPTGTTQGTTDVPSETKPLEDNINKTYTYEAVVAPMQISGDRVVGRVIASDTINAGEVITVVLTDDTKDKLALIQSHAVISVGYNRYNADTREIIASYVDILN